MDVEQLEPAQQRLADQLAERADDPDLGPGGENPLGRRGVAGVGGLQQLDPQRPCGAGNGRRRGAAPPASRPVRRGDREQGPVLTGGEPLEDRDRELGSAQEGGAQR
jgi:hypothetical protein